ncbi:MAG TPA: DUF494 family protein [Thermodesulfobacteriota bacterium]|nr:DUF494 family protein [Thermodesulfobacteriota bacterium]
MRERFLDIVTRLAQYMLEDERGLHDEQTITEELVAQGYDPDDVREAFAWLEQLTASRRPPAAPADAAASGAAIRVLTAAEALRITPAAHGYLLRLKQLGLIDGATEEAILERAMRLDADEIGVEEMKGVAALVLFNQAPSEWRGHLLDVLDDRWDRLYH